MKQADSYSTAEELLQTIGSRVRYKRVQMGMKQVDLAARAGVGLSTIQRLEHGQGSTLEVFIRAALVLREEGWLEQFAKIPQVDPSAVFNKQPIRKRVR